MPGQAFTAGADLDPGNERLLEARSEAEAQLSGAQLGAAAQAARQRSAPGAAVQKRFTVEIGMRFPQVRSPCQSCRICSSHRDMQ